jgi:hypothetical protein
MGQVVGYLPGSSRPLSSNPSTAQNTKIKDFNHVHPFITLIFCSPPILLVPAPNGPPFTFTFFFLWYRFHI